VGALLGHAVSAVGCERDLVPATAVAVLVKTELGPEQLSHVEFKVHRSVGDDPDYTTPVAKYITPVEELKRPFVITRAHADTFLLSVVGYARSGGEPVIVYREQVTFQEGKTLALPVYLAKACYERPCPFDDMTCYGASYGGVAPGECSSYPMRQLEPIVRPGDESKWEPVPTQPRSMDAGFRPSFDPDDYFDEDDESYPSAPRFDGGLTFPPCNALSTGRSCTPSTLVLDASSYPPLLDRQ
jgi:hypothetical protein